MYDTKNMKALGLQTIKNTLLSMNSDFLRPFRLCQAESII